MLLSVEATLVGGLLPLFSQYRTDRGWHPAARARSACVSPASIRAARIWRPETMLLITRLYIRFWKRRHRPPCFILSGRPDAATALVRFRGTKHYGIFAGIAGSIRFDARELHHFGRLFGFVGEELTEVGR